MVGEKLKVTPSSKLKVTQKFTRAYKFQYYRAIDSRLRSELAKFNYRELLLSSAHHSI